MLRKFGIAALAMVGGCLGLFAAAFAVAQTGPAKDQISGYVADTLSNPQQQAEVEQLGGFLPLTSASAASPCATTRASGWR
jgi:hypothetical protein